MSSEMETVEDIRKDVVLRILWEYTPSEVLDIIDRVADAARREGVKTCLNMTKVFKGDDYDRIGFNCSECAFDDDNFEEANYCPGCGRKVE
ncbi:MAG: hypothetical protein HGA54_00845 [Actinobacteria bacterium]|nr:hypothetical protein [Actinomycetota bacterium]